MDSELPGAAPRLDDLGTAGSSPVEFAKIGIVRQLQDELTPIAALRRQLAISNRPVTRQTILDKLVEIVREHLTDLTTGQILDLGMRCEQEADLRFDDELAHHRGEPAALDVDSESTSSSSPQT